MNTGWLDPIPEDWEEAADVALLEDIGPGDVSSALLPQNLELEWRIEAQADGVLCGAGIALDLICEDDEVRCHFNDGSSIHARDVVIEGKSDARLLLSNERTLLNFLMHLSGIATLTSHFVTAIEGTNAKIVDTRKTTPGLRILEKYAVRCGGGSNHRMGLYDGVMIKDNHIRALGGISSAVKTARSKSNHLLKIEVECETLEQVAEAAEAGAEVIMLDNMEVPVMKLAVAKFGGHCLFEASGGVNLETVREIAQTGVDFISVGAITHSAMALPFHLEVR